MSQPDARAFEAIVFDFDGLMLDTEMPLYVSWRRTFEHFGVQPIALNEWSQSVGLHDDDPRLIKPLDRLRAALDVDQHPSEEDLQRMRRGFRNEMLDAQSLMPGVVDLIERAQKLAVPIAIASSSPFEWIDDQLGRRGFLDHFPVISCAGNGVPGKPDPTVYRLACERLDVDPARALALEDSVNGVHSAKAAGMTCWAVPSEVTRGLNFSAADKVLTSVADVNL